MGNQFHSYFHRPCDLASYRKLYMLSTSEYGQCQIPKGFIAI